MTLLIDLRPAEQAAPVAPTAQAGREPPGPRAHRPLAPARAVWRWLVQTHDRIDGCWVGDVIGGVSLFLTFVILIIIAGVLS